MFKKIKSSYVDYAIIQILVLREKVKTKKGIIQDFFSKTRYLLQIQLRSHTF